MMFATESEAHTFVHKKRHRFLMSVSFSCCCVLFFVYCINYAVCLHTVVRVVKLTGFKRMDGYAGSMIFRIATANESGELVFEN